MGVFISSLPLRSDWIRTRMCVKLDVKRASLTWNLNSSKENRNEAQNLLREGIRPSFSSHILSPFVQVDGGVPRRRPASHHRTGGGAEEWGLPCQTRKLLLSQSGVLEENLRSRADQIQGESFLAWGLNFHKLRRLVDFILCKSLLRNMCVFVLSK